MKTITFIILIIPLVSFCQTETFLDFNSERSIINYFDENPPNNILEGLYLDYFGSRLVIKKDDRTSNKFSIISFAGKKFKRALYRNSGLNKIFPPGDTIGTIEVSSGGSKLFLNTFFLVKRCGGYRNSGSVRNRNHPEYRECDKKDLVGWKSVLVEEAIYVGDPTETWYIKPSSSSVTMDLNSDWSGGRALDLELEFLFRKIYPERTVNEGNSIFKRKEIKPKTAEWLGNGSGIIISKSGYIITNHHVIDDADDIEVEFIIDSEVKKFNAEIVQVDKKNDLAVIKIFDMNFDGLDDLPYNFKTRSSDVGTKIYAYGYPMALSLMGKEIKITDGIISSKSGFDGDITTYQITAPIQGGNSGGPLFDDKGNFLGINSSGLRKDIADNVGYTIKSSYVLNLIDVLPKSIELPSNTKLKSLPLTEQIKEISKYVVLVKVK